MTPDDTLSVAIATCAAWPDPGPGLLPLIEALTARGFDVTCLPWQSVDEQAFLTARVILPLCAWDYAAAPRAFRDWIARIAAGGGRFANAPDLMLWNMEKSYLLDLAACGVPVPRTHVIADPSAGTVAARMREEGWGRAVLKPAIGQSGNGVTLLELARIGNWPQMPPGAHVLQEFQADIGETGETTLTFFGGAFSHAVLRRPAAGEWRANSQYGVALERIRPDKAVIEVARRALAALPTPPAYVRVDGIARPGREFLVTEIELIEPALFLHLCPGKAERIVDLLCCAA